MIVQAISLLDDLDKELNNYVMRCREWFGWHFPELSKIITDNIAYAKTVKAMGTRTKVADQDFSEILPEEVEEQLKAAAEISMGVEVRYCTVHVNNRVVVLHVTAIFLILDRL